MYKEEKNMHTEIETKSDDQYIYTCEKIFENEKLDETRYYRKNNDDTNTSTFGELHREDGPAVEFLSGFKAYMINGKYHRENGPALEYTDGTEFWYKHGDLHREDGPAINTITGYNEYWVNGERHREDGPAFDSREKTQYWLHGKQFTKEEFLLKTDRLKGK